MTRPLGPTCLALPKSASRLAFQVVVLIGLAILRSQLFDIDVIIRKTLVYPW